MSAAPPENRICYPRRLRTIDLVYFDAGGGHRAAATALKLIIEQQQRPWNPRMLHLQDVLAPVDIFKKVLRIDLQEIYNQMLQRGWTFGSPQAMRFMQLMIRLFHSGEVKLLRDWFQRDAPDMLVSVVPNFNRAIFDGYQAVAPGRPYVTILTDLADYPPRFWIERQQQYFICGTPKAEQQAYAFGHPKERVFRTSGMILHPRFYSVPEIDRPAERARLGLDPSKPTALVLFGGFGSMEMLAIHKRLEAAGHDLQAIYVCGRNEKLRAELERAGGRMPRHVVGFTSEVPYYMRLADFFIGKPGPGSVSEAVHLGLPVITVSNHMTLPQERYNPVWLEENELGVALKSYRDVADAARRLLEGDTLARFRANCAKLQNRAVFEIPDLLEHIWQQHYRV